MNLHETLAGLVKDNGVEIFESPELHLHEAVEKALYGYPAVASVFAKAVTSGSLRRMVAGGLWDDDARRIMEKFVIHTGFQPALVDFVFRAAATAAGIDTGKNLDFQPAVTAGNEPAAGNATEPEPRYGIASGENPAWNGYLSMAEKARFITSIIETDTELEDELGVTVKYPFCTKAEESAVHLSLEISRTSPMATAALHAALYNMDNAIVFHGLAAALTLSSPSRLPVTLRLPCTPSTLSRILLYWR